MATTTAQQIMIVRWKDAGAGHALGLRNPYLDYRLEDGERIDGPVPSAADMAHSGYRPALSVRMPDGQIGEMWIAD